MSSNKPVSLRPIDLRIVLVRSIYERNIGAASRAMANMGFKKLILVDPKCEITIEGHQAAASGQFALQNKVVYSSWAEFYEKEPRGFQISTTARDGRGRQSNDLETTLRLIQDTHPSISKESDQALVFHLIFGPEDWGLSGDDIQYSNHCCSLPTYGDNTSFNLGQAALMAMYIFRSVFGGTRTQLEGQQVPKERQKKPAVFPDQSLKLWLQVMGFDLTKRKMNVFTVLRRMLLQNAPSTKEFRILEIALQQSIRRMKTGSEDPNLTITPADQD
ncbi:MAG: RNA methyltransferase [Pseudobdellovibrio sp.]